MQGMKIDGLSDKEVQTLINHVQGDSELRLFSQELINITKGDGYATPRTTWLKGTITTDLIDLLSTTKRKKYPKCKTGRSHHWILEVPSGTYSKGTCKICRKVVKGLFRNSLDYSIWFQKSNKGNSLRKYALGNNRETGNPALPKSIK